MPTPLPFPSVTSLQALARAAVQRALLQWPSARRLAQDLEQEAALAAWESLQTWDASRSAWNTWAWWAMKTALRRYLLGNIGPLSQPHSNKTTNAPRTIGVTLSESLVAETPAPDVRAMALLALSALVRAATQGFRPFHRRSPCGLTYEAFVERDVGVFVGVVLGTSVVDAAQAARLSRQAVYACLQRTVGLCSS
jgi:hypothetical protein